MRILFLSNFYPPAHPGGYSQWCQEVAESLRHRGHRIGVATSSYEREKASTDEQDVYRVLHLDGDIFRYRPRAFLFNWRREQQENRRRLAQVISDFQPDLCFVWGMWAMSKSVPALAEQMLPSRVVYYLCDYWPADADMHTNYWGRPARRWYMRLPRKLLRRRAHAILEAERCPALKLEHVICVSAAVRQLLVEAGIPVEHARVIHGGTDLTRFSHLEAYPPRNPGRLELLYAGQLVAHKGVHTAIDAVAHLVSSGRTQGFHLGILGSGDPDYEDAIRARVERDGLSEYITFHGSAPKAAIPEHMRRADVLVFPSIYEEPFARVTQEAMLAGLAVVGTTTGGSKELLVDGENSLTFPAGDALALAAQVRRLIDQPWLCGQLAEAGRRSVLEKFTLDRMVDGIEAYLEEIGAPGPRDESRLAGTMRGFSTATSPDAHVRLPLALIRTLQSASARANDADTGRI